MDRMQHVHVFDFGRLPTRQGSAGPAQPGSSLIFFHEVCHRVIELCGDLKGGGCGSDAEPNWAKSYQINGRVSVGLLKFDFDFVNDDETVG
jgi:hypothetical protein